MGDDDKNSKKALQKAKAKLRNQQRNLKKMKMD